MTKEPHFSEERGGVFVLISIRYLKFDCNIFYNLSIYNYNLHDKQNFIITGSLSQ